MKIKSLLSISSLCVLISSYSFAGCWDMGGCSSNYCDQSLYENSCQCTDPVCNSVDLGCLSKSECCEAFGNVGAR